MAAAGHPPRRSCRPSGPRSKITAAGTIGSDAFATAVSQTAVAAGRTDNLTLVGAQLFLWGRVAYAIVYLIGLPWLRTAVWAVSVLGLILIFAQLL